MMKLKCKYVEASQAADEIFQIHFEVMRDDLEQPYVLVQRAWLPEDEDECGPIYVETHDERLTGHYRTVDATLTRNRLILQLPPPAPESVEVEFDASERKFTEVRRILGIILKKDLEKEEKRNANQSFEHTR